jgi:hypothetical protein
MDKPVYKSSSFWFTFLGQALAGAAASGQMPEIAGTNPGWVQLLGLVLTALLPLGYKYLRLKEQELTQKISSGSVSTTTPGGLKSPEVSAQTIALQAGLEAVLKTFDEKAKAITAAKPSLM